MSDPTARDADTGPHDVPPDVSPEVSDAGIGEAVDLGAGIERLDDTWISADGDDVLGVQVNEEGHHKHSIFLNVLGFVRTEPAETKARTALVGAIQGVEGVVLVVAEDRESYVVRGPASGEAIIRAAAATLADLAAELAQHVPS